MTRRKDLKKLDAKTLRIGVAALIALVVVVVVLVSSLGGDDGGAPESATASNEEVVALSEEELRSRVAESGATVYWVGAMPNTTSFEYTRTGDGRFYVRNLSEDAEAGDPRPDFVTIGTYPVADAKQALKTAEEADPGQRIVKKDGYEVLAGKDASSAYVVFDDQPDLQVEVFAPNPGEARLLATSGALAPID